MCCETSVRYHIKRQDDNGNVVIMPQCYVEKYVAELEANRLERLGHKQIYWVDPATNCEHAVEMN